MCAWQPESNQFGHHDRLGHDDDRPNKGTDSNLEPTDENDLSGLFVALTKKLQERFDIDRGLLVIREDNSTRLLATSTFSDLKVRKNLSLRIPAPSSLFEKVAEQGETFAESFCDLFSGNSFEKKLLMDDDAQAYILLPLKYEGRVVGLLGYSSQTPMAFTLHEIIESERLTCRLARCIGYQLAQTQSKI